MINSYTVRRLSVRVSDDEGSGVDVKEVKNFRTFYQLRPHQTNVA